MDILAGMKIGRWTVIQKASKRGEVYWVCQCDCGEKRAVYGHSLKAGKSKSCGCLGGGRKQDLIGKEYGRLTVIKQATNSRTGNTRWLCRCECGKERIVFSSSLKSGHTLSCGCLHREISSIVAGKWNSTHGMTGTPVYGSWLKMRYRCSPTTKDCRRNYYDRGIAVCKKWKDSPENFIKWALGNGFDENLELDRINNNSGYSPGNCRFVDKKTQARNRRTNIIVGYKGVCMSFAEFAERFVFGCSYDTAKARYRRGWSLEKIITTPVRKHRVSA